MRVEFNLQKRRRKMLISNDIIDKVPRTHIMDRGGEIDTLLQHFHKRLLNISKNKNSSNEVGFLIDMRNWEHLIIQGTESGISLQSNDSARKLLAEAPDLSLIFIHNHPNNTCFSYIDLNSFCNHKSIYLITAIGNNANIHILKKSEGFNSDATLLTYNKNSKNEQGIKSVLQQCKHLGIEYKFGRRRK